MDDELGPYGARAWNYAHAVIDGEIDACLWVKRACQRFLDDLDRDDADWFYDAQKGHDPCAYIETLRHVKGSWAKRKETIKLQDWQCFIYCNIFGFVYKYDVFDDNGECIALEGTRRFRTVYIEVPRKNAKTTTAAGAVKYLFSEDGEAGPEVYTAATSRDQAKICFDIAKRMTALEDESHIQINAHHMADLENAGIMRPLHAEGTTMDGLNISAVCNDELHAWKRRDVYEVIETAVGARDNYLILNITTAGTNIDGVAYDQRIYLTKILEGSVTDDAYFGVIYTIDEGDDWKDPEVWKKANPNYGVSVSPLQLQNLANQARKMPAKRTSFLTKHLNAWQTAGSAWMNLEQWDACADPSLKLEDFHGEECILGNDHASKRDLSAQAIVFQRVIDDKPHWYAFMRYYLPETAVRDSFQQYDGWTRRGLIRQTPGSMLDVDRIEHDTMALADDLDVLEIAVDPGHNSTQYGVHMEQQGFEVIDVRPNRLNFSEPMKWLEAYVMEGRFHFNGDPVLTWNISNVTCKIDHMDNYFPAKERDANKIDGAIALLMAVNRWRARGDVKSAYNDRGVLFV